MIGQWITQEFSGLDHKDWQLLKSLDTPAKIQDFINSLKFNHEWRGETHRSVKEALRYREAHCFEGALLAATALWIHGYKPLLLDLVADKSDFDHVVAIFSDKGGPASGGKVCWGAISKTNHAVLRYREPIYKTARELALSYFHEYFLKNGKKTLRKFSKPFDLSRYGTVWVSGDENLAWLAHALDASPHTDILTPKQISSLRKADKVEIEAGEIVEYW